MAIYRGPGGSGDATNDATSQSIIATQAAIEAAESAIQAAASAVSASNSATAASNSESAASTSATNASNFADDAADYATAAASALDEFTDLYLGAKTTNPSLDNDGNALQTGALYFNTVANEFRVYTGIEWQVITVGAVGDSVITQTFSGDGNTVAFTLSTEPFSENSTFVYINGAYQQKNTYNVSGLTLTFSEAPPSGTDNIEVLTITMVDIDNITASIINIADAGGYYASSKVEGALQEVGRKLSETVSVKDFGAVGDGVTDDTAAITDADVYAASIGATLYFPDGVYAAKNLVATAGWDMSSNAKLLYNGASYGELLRCSANGLKFGRLHLDLNAEEPFTGFYLDGDNNHFQYIRVENATSDNQIWVVRSIYVIGDNNVIESVFLKDLVNTGNLNNSSPQGLVTSSIGNNNSFTNVVSYNATATVVNNSSASNNYGQIFAYEAKDNGFYAVNGHSSVGSVFYDGDNDGCGFRGFATAEIGSIFLNRVEPLGKSIFFGECGDISIGSIFANNIEGSLLHTNLADTGHIRIGNILGSMHNNYPVFFTVTNGPVKHLTINNMDLQVNVDSDAVLSPTSFMRMTACEGVTFGTIKVDIVLANTVTTSLNFYARLASSLPRQSTVDAFRVAVYSADGETLSPVAGFFGENFIQQNLKIKEGSFNSSLLLIQSNSDEYRVGQLVFNGEPTTGYWKQGTVLWRLIPSAGAVGSICTVSGTPGTWVTFG